MASSMSMLVDSHCHLHSLDLTAYNGELDRVMTQATEAGVGHFLCVCVEPEDISKLHALAERYANISISVGIHPNTELACELDVDELIVLSQHASCIAIGETGLDYYRTEGELNRAQQSIRFRTHIQAARATKKPLIIHTRQASEETLQLMKEEQANEIGGVMHCFSENWDVARRALDLGFYISFSGIVTFKNALELQSVAKKVPLDRMLIETDSPYLAPVPYRGQQNHPGLVRYVAEALSALRGESFETIALQTTENFYHCFRIEK